MTQVFHELSDSRSGAEHHDVDRSDAQFAEQVAECGSWVGGRFESQAMNSAALLFDVRSQLSDCGIVVEIECADR